MSGNFGASNEYTLSESGILRREDGFAFCGRCGRTPIINDKCLNCDVQPTSNDRGLAETLKRYCYSERQERQPGFVDFRPEKFDIERAAKVIAAWKSVPEELCPIHGISYVECACTT